METVKKSAISVACFVAGLAGGAMFGWAIVFGIATICLLSVTVPDDMLTTGGGAVLTQHTTAAPPGYKSQALAWGVLVACCAWVFAIIFGGLFSLVLQLSLVY